MLHLDKASSSDRTRRNCKRLKITAHAVKLGPLWAIGYKRARIKLPFLRCWEQKPGTACDRCTRPQQGGGQIPLSNTSCPAHRICPVAAPLKGPEGTCLLFLPPCAIAQAQYSLRLSSGLLSASADRRVQGPGLAANLRINPQIQNNGTTMPAGCLKKLTS